jgi:DNA-directed RNA polymerase specialized sigma24 family protein
MAVAKIAEGEWVRPRTVNEFVERWPDYVKNFCTNSYVQPQQREDMAQELMLKLCASQAIEKYDPEKRGGAAQDTPGQFFNYIIMVLKRAQQAIMARRQRDAMRHLAASGRSENSWVEDAERLSSYAAVRAGQDRHVIRQQVLGRVAEACPAYAYTFSLLVSGASIKDISEATGISMGTLRNIVQAIVPAALAGEKPRRSQSYRKLEELGEYPLTVPQ